MFLLALTAFLLLALGLSARAVATRNKAAVRAADREGMPERAQTNHPAHTWEARVTSDASSRPARSGTCPASEGDDLDHINTPADAALCNTTHTGARTHGLPSSASPAPSRGLALGVSRDMAGQLYPPRKGRAHGPDLSSRTASPRPRIKPGDVAELGARSTTTPALT